MSQRMRRLEAQKPEDQRGRTHSGVQPDKQLGCPVCDYKGTFSVLRPGWRNLPPPAEEKVYCSCALGMRLWEQLDGEARNSSLHISANQPIFLATDGEVSAERKAEISRNERDYQAYRKKWGLK